MSDLAFGRIARDHEVHRRDVVLHRPDLGACGGELFEELVNCARREFAVFVDGVVVIKASEAFDVTAVDSSSGLMPRAA